MKTEDEGSVERPGLRVSDRGRMTMRLGHRKEGKTGRNESGKRKEGKETERQKDEEVAGMERVKDESKEGVRMEKEDGRSVEEGNGRKG